MTLSPTSFTLTDALRLWPSSACQPRPRCTGATIDDLHEAVAMIEDTVRIARRVFGGSHPTTLGIEKGLRKSRAALRKVLRSLRARETPSTSA